MSLGKEAIRNRWGYHKGNAETILKHERIREAYILLADFLDEILPDGRAKSSAFTKLQESSMWANFGIAELSPLEIPKGEHAFHNNALSSGKPATDTPSRETLLP